MSEFRNFRPEYYNFAYRNNLLPQIRKIYGKDFTRWTYENLKDVASNYDSRFDFQKGNASAYQSARRQGYLNDFFPSPKQTKGEEGVDEVAGIG
jgi:hypothetical protein